MSIRTKTLLITGVTILGLLITVSGISVRVLLDGINRLEVERVQTNTERVNEAINVQLDYLRTKTTDWAYWDDTYNFVADHNPQYIATNLVSETFVNLNVDSILCLDEKSLPVYAKTYKPATSASASASASLIEVTEQISKTLLTKPLDADITGFILLPEGFMYVAARQILHSDNTGPARGVLLFGKNFDQKEITRLAGITKTKLEVDRLDEKLLPQDEQIVKELTGNKTFVTTVLSNTEIAGYALQKDINDKNIWLIEVIQNRDFYLEGARSVKILLTGFACSGLIFLITVLIVLEKLVIAPIVKLRMDVDRISESGDLHQRLKDTGSKDELGFLTRVLNKMLRSVEEEKTYAQTYMDTVDVLMLVLNSDGSITYMNSKGCELLGYSRQDLLNKNWFDTCIPEQDRSSGRTVFAQLMKGDVQGVETYKNSILTSDGKEKIFEWHNGILRDINGATTGTVSVGQDVSEKVKKEEDARTYAEDLERINRLLVGRELKMAELKNEIEELKSKLH